MTPSEIRKVAALRLVCQQVLNIEDADDVESVKIAAQQALRESVKITRIVETSADKKKWVEVAKYGRYGKPERKTKKRCKICRSRLAVVGCDGRCGSEECAPF